MSTSVQAVLEEALQLPSTDRAAIVEGLVMSLDQPDNSLDALWLKEAQSRMAAYHSGELNAVDAGDVFAKLGKEL
jgi:putative addiction module component (TIGR02574 family)